MSGRTFAIAVIAPGIAPIGNSAPAKKNGRIAIHMDANAAVDWLGASLACET